jgi:hypothetical protein
MGHELTSRLHWYDGGLNLGLGSSVRRGRRDLVDVMASALGAGLWEMPIAQRRGRVNRYVGRE